MFGGVFGLDTPGCTRAMRAGTDFYLNRLSLTASSSSDVERRSGVWWFGGRVLV